MRGGGWCAVTFDTNAARDAKARHAQPIDPFEREDGRVLLAASPVDSHAHRQEENGIRDDDPRFDQKRRVEGDHQSCHKRGQVCAAELSHGEVADRWKQLARYKKKDKAAETAEAERSRNGYSAGNGGNPPQRNVEITIVLVAHTGKVKVPVVAVQIPRIGDDELGERRVDVEVHFVEDVRVREVSEVDLVENDIPGLFQTVEARVCGDDRNREDENAVGEQPSEPLRQKGLGRRRCGNAAAFIRFYFASLASIAVIVVVVVSVAIVVVGEELSRRRSFILPHSLLRRVHSAY